MGRLAIQFMILGVLVNAGVRVIPPFWHFAQFQDAVLEVTRLSGRLSEPEIRDKVAVLADRYGIPLTAADFTIKKEGQKVKVSAAYHLDLEYIPSRTYPYDFVLDAEGVPPRFDAVQ